jgi:predicted RNase H-like HicB family nuclease
VIDLKYSLVIEATDDPNFFGFYSPDLEGFTAIGHSVEDCLYKARWGIEEHVAIVTTESTPVAVIPAGRSPFPPNLEHPRKNTAAVASCRRSCNKSLRRDFGNCVPVVYLIMKWRESGLGNNAGAVRHDVESMLDEAEVKSCATRMFG